MVYTEKRIEQEMHRHGFKITPQRRAVLNVIVDSHEHLTPAAVHERVIKEHPAVGLVTVYRTIEILAELGFICEMHTGGNYHSYLFRRPAEHHHHLICSGCGKVVDFVDCNLDKLEHRLAQENSFKINSHLLEFQGQCRECHNSNGNKRKIKPRERVEA